MSRRRKWDYCQLPSRCGTMRCTACGKQITEGEYRVRDTDEAYLTQHRECSKDDPNWSVRDKDRADGREAYERFILAAREFRSQWKSFLDSDFDDYCHDNMTITAKGERDGCE